MAKRVAADGPVSDAALRLVFHVISFRYQSYSWIGEQSVLAAKCLAEQSGGLYITVDTEQDLVAALEKTLDCPMISQRRIQLANANYLVRRNSCRSLTKKLTSPS